MQLELGGFDGLEGPGVQIDVGFERSATRLSKTLRLGDCTFSSSIGLGDDPPPGSDFALWWHRYLRGTRPEPSAQIGELRVAELFCGSGGLAQGVKQFCREVGLGLNSVAAVDIDERAVEVYVANHGTTPEFVRSGPDGDLANLVDHELYGRAETARFLVPPGIKDEAWDALGDGDGVDLLIAGPPCQGHSNLNNHTRRNDLRNLSYLDVPAVAVALDCPTVIMENVQAVVHDRYQVVSTTRRLFEAAGYTVTSAALHAGSMGWPQKRSRFFLVASAVNAPIPLESVKRQLTVDEGPLDLWWAISDLEDMTEDDHHMFRQANRTAKNRERIEYLFDHDVHDLPDHQRPPCHAEGGHTYPAVYGRLHKDRPAPTVTSGFLTTGRGRYVHPTRRRTINPREAARLQGFPDDYTFEPTGTRPRSTDLGKWIGDAVPMPLGYAAALSALGNRLRAGAEDHRSPAERVARWPGYPDPEDLPVVVGQ